MRRERRCDGPDARRFGRRWCRSYPAGITTPSSWTARAGWPTPRRPWPAMRTTANPARCSPSEVAREAHLHACGAPVARGHGGRGTGVRPPSRCAPPPAVVGLAARARDGDLVEFRRAVERDIARGAPPAAATAAAVTAADVWVNAGARQQRPGPP